MIETKVEIRLPKINFDLTRIFKRAGLTVAMDMKHGIDTNKDISGNRFPPLADATIFAKGHEQPLIDLNVLRRSFAVKVEKKNWVTIFIQDKGTPPRDEVGYRLQVEGVEQKTGLRKHFMFFGISDRARKKIWRDITNEIRRILASARK